MSSKAVNKDICPACAADIRAGAVFCFNCGSSFQDLSGKEPAEPVVAEEAPDVGGAEESDPKPGKVQRGQVKVERAAKEPRRPLRPARRELKVEWTAPEEGPGAAFVLGAAAVGVVSLVLFLMALYMK